MVRSRLTVFLEKAFPVLTLCMSPRACQRIHSDSTPETSSTARYFSYHHPAPPGLVVGHRRHAPRAG